ncbi:hypothetical protein pETSU_248 [Edwardsiella phage pEt-SU]|uniref:Uncharacterized protein n=1 Tax=Edwardsiella phage pEt-SU TaxID=2562142 RepID=A0A4D6DYU4_9CAUD|nr:hypothetical protein HOV39_gp274 [Edwardsiella phage pEt-SU]QBZ70829.1 hypothetical protein pETSU_248 [Edwardsiella phage pEt-SU]
MKLEYFGITTKENTTCYDTVAAHIAKTFYHVKLNGDKAIANDFIAEMRVQWHADGIEGDIRVMSHDVASLMEWLKDNHPEVHVLVPPFRIDVFQELANQMKSSSHLTYQAVAPDQEMEYEFGVEPDTDDFVPERASVEESLEAIKANGFYTGLQCYPNTPVGFWSFYGLDFESLFNQILEEEE